jgi:dihydrofolate synthase/folylpolyglutamate synthase
LIPKEDVWGFVQKWQDTFDHLDMSFFEITTSMALDWFAGQKVDYVVLETGLGGRLDSTNIVSPIISIITNIGLDHCDLLGETLPEIAFEKAGIIKPRVPVVIGESNPETDSVFERKVLYTNLSEPLFMGNRTSIMSLLTFADKMVPTLWDEHDAILNDMDLRGSYQSKNLRTVLAALEVLGARPDRASLVRDAIVHTAERTGFRGRWEQVMDNPRVICDIGHNEHGLKYNFAQLRQMQESGEISRLVIVYGSVADKDVDAAVSLFPENAVYVFTKAQGKRAMPAEEVRDRYVDVCTSSGKEPAETYCFENVSDAVEKAFVLAGGVSETMTDRPLIYIGGSTYVVSEAMAVLSE